MSLIIDVVERQIDSILRNSSNDEPMIYACLCEAKKLNRQPAVLAVLKAMLMQEDWTNPSGVHVAILLRWYLDMLIKILKQQAMPNEGGLESVTTMFQKGM